MYRDGMEVVEENMGGIEVLPLILLRGGGRRSTRIGIDGGTYRVEAMEMEMEMVRGGKMIGIENLDGVPTVNTVPEMMNPT